MGYKQLVQITKLIVDLSEKSRNVSLANAYLDAFGLNVSSIIGQSKANQLRSIKLYESIIKKISNISEWR